MAARFYILLAVAGGLSLQPMAAQPVVAPTPESVGVARGVNMGNYNITNSFETGYRFAEVSGDLDKYRADVNYGNGIRLLGSSLAVYSRDGHGHLFDQVLLNTLGLGNDPYQNVTLRVEKNGLYRYDLLWRLDDYFNPGLNISADLHRMDDSRVLEDQDLTLFPQGKFRFRAGYSRNTQTGPGLSSVQQFNSSGNAFPVFTDLHRGWNEYRVGAEGQFAGFKFTFLHRWDFYKDDTPYNGVAGPAFIAPGVGGVTPVLTQFYRAEPNHGSNPGWFGDLLTNRKHWGINALITYNSGRNSFALNENAVGQAFGAAANRQILVSGNAQRPVTSGDFNLNVYPTEKLTIVNSTAAYSTRIQGDSNFTEFDNGGGGGATLNFRYLGVRTVSNSTDINYRLTPVIGFYTGYGYSDRLIHTIEGFSFQGPLENAVYDRSSHLNTWTVGVQIRPIQPLTIRLNGAIGRANQPLTPISDSSYHTLGSRIDYRTSKLQLSASYSQVYNVNAPLAISAYSSHSRNYNASLSWAPNGRFSLEGSYAKLHLDTVSSLAFFAGLNALQFYQGFPQLYVSNIHSANLGAHGRIAPRVDLYVGYSIVKDTGDGRPAAIPAGTTDPVQALFSSVQTFPLTYQSPLLRISIRISEKVRWNAGWQFYNYHEQFGLLGQFQQYHANTGYTSVLWAF
jgi:hypothetical protein